MKRFSRPPASGTTMPGRIVSVTQPRFVNWIWYFGPAVMGMLWLSLVLLGAESENWLEAVRHEWPVGAVFVICPVLPLLLAVQKVEADYNGIRINHYLGRGASFAWEEIRWVGMYGINPSRLTQQRMVRLYPERGRNRSLFDHMTGFDELARFLATTGKAQIRTVPSGRERLLYGANQKFDFKRAENLPRELR